MAFDDKITIIEDMPCCAIDLATTSLHRICDVGFLIIVTGECLYSGNSERETE